VVREPGKVATLQVWRKGRRSQAGNKNVKSRTLELEAAGDRSPHFLTRENDSGKCSHVELAFSAPICFDWDNFSVGGWRREGRTAQHVPPGTDLAPPTPAFQSIRRSCTLCQGVQTVQGGSCGPQHHEGCGR
jgi:hypothetical protein